MKKLLIDSHIIYLISILAIGAIFRFYNLNWDQNQHLHPDERFLTMVTEALKWPSDISEYFSTNTSPLNPHNQNFSFYVYGTFPLFVVKYFSEVIKFDNYNQITILGRAISSILDLFVIFLIYLIGRKVFSKPVGLLSAFLYGVLVLPIQLSHFYAMDTFLNFFLILTTYLLIKSIYTPRFILFILAGTSFGLALASKVTAFLIIPAILLSYTYLLYKFKTKIIFLGGAFLILSFITFRIMQPYAFSGPSFFDITLNPKFTANLQELKRLSQPDDYFPPGVQWNNTTPIIYPLKELFIWGLGIPAGIISLLVIVLSLIKIFEIIFERKQSNLLHPSTVSVILLVIITLAIFIYQGIQFAKPLRYFYPMLPSLIILISYALFEILNKLSIKIRTICFVLLIILWSVWPISFMSIYTRPHSRVQASEWIYQNIPPGSSISAEHWDDALPLSLPGKTNSTYNSIEFPLFGPDTKEKWLMINERLKQVDYIILTSNRLYGSMSRSPKTYPITTNYYQDLFEGKLGFEKVAEFTSRPSIPIPGINLCINLPFADYGKVSEKSQECNQNGITIVDDYIDEISTVYDHPKITIFKKIYPVNYSLFPSIIHE